MEGRILALAATQHGMVSRSQLLDLGLSRRSLSTWLRRKRLRQIHRGVYLVGAVLPEWGLAMAALLACGEHATLSHWTAARLDGLPVPDDDGTVHVIMPRGGSGRRNGVRVQRTAGLHATEVRCVHGLRATTPARTLFDLATALGRASGTRRLEQLVAMVLERRLASPAELRRVVERHASYKGAGLLRLMLAQGGGPRLARSEAEEMLLKLLRDADLPLPRVNVRVARYEVDCCWAAERLIVEVDGYAWHSSRNRFEADRERDAVLTGAGYTVLRITWRQIMEEPLRVVARIAFMLGRLSRR